MIGLAPKGLFKRCLSAELWKQIDELKGLKVLLTAASNDERQVLKLRYHAKCRVQGSGRRDKQVFVIVLVREDIRSVSRMNKVVNISMVFRNRLPMRNS